MAFFEQSHGMQINGGNFYNVAGSMNVQQQFPVATLGSQQYLPQLRGPSGTGTSGAQGSGGIPQPSIHGVQRSIQAAGSTRYQPYNGSGRRQITSNPHQPQVSQFESNMTSYDHSLGSEAPANNGHGVVTSSSREPGQHQPTTTIYGGTFVSGNIQHGSVGGINLLHGAVALAALHDSGESFPQPRCHPETRTEIMRKLHKWSLGTDLSTAILWLHGPAGAGKSAIMQTFSSELQAARRLGGSFFFKRDHATRGNAKTLFATIAYQLALSVSWLKAPISRTVEEDPSILARSLQIQLQKLISEPAQLRPIDENQKPIIIVVDGLDECEDQHIQEEVLHAIQNYTSQHHLPFRFIVASCPEAHICEVFESPFYCGRYHSVDVEKSFNDVEKYLCDEFSRIHREHRTMENIPSPWPSPEILEELVSKSSGYFIYASTVIKFIDDKYYRPTKRLAVILNGTSSDSAFDAPDQLYMKILSSVPHQAQLLLILCAIANFDFGPEGLDQLLTLEQGDARLLLRGLYSVLDIPEKDNSSLPISPHHASFFDFLNNPRRSGTFYVGSSHNRMGLAQSLLSLLAGEFRMDIAGCGSTWKSPLCFIPFITSLPPCTELLSPIKQLNPDYVFERYWDLKDFDKFLQWLKKIPGVPADLVELWEDYEYMSFFVEEFHSAMFHTTPNKSSVLPTLDIVFQIPGMQQLLQILMLAMMNVSLCLREICPLIGLTWDDLKNIICALRPIIGRDVNNIHGLADHMLHGSFFGEIYPWPTPCCDLARHLIRRAHATGSFKEGLKR
ncbi:NACHT domain-containing protein [Mycena sanguinolenta]|uniref:NACHT domain-containing protein n=1 Tax=Mycena sanguinolenta TaxID=230812 RepID=A0A8H6ZKT9_9AGAR|nr:NACHT domain-containing protein [Mycena sanguinolenta]